MTNEERKEQLHIAEMLSREGERQKHEAEMKLYHLKSIYSERQTKLMPFTIAGHLLGIWGGIYLFMWLFKG